MEYCSLGYVLAEMSGWPWLARGFGPVNSIGHQTGQPQPPCASKDLARPAQWATPWLAMVGHEVRSSQRDGSTDWPAMVAKGWPYQCNVPNPWLAMAGQRGGPANSMGQQSGQPWPPWLTEGSAEPGRCAKPLAGYGQPEGSAQPA